MQRAIKIITKEKCTIGNDYKQEIEILKKLALFLFCSLINLIIIGSSKYC